MGDLRMIVVNYLFLFDNLNSPEMQVYKNISNISMGLVTSTRQQYRSYKAYQFFFNTSILISDDTIAVIECISKNSLEKQ